MKRLCIILVSCMCMLWHAHAYTAYFTAAELASGTSLLPAPPDSTSMDFTRDLSAYFSGKAIRLTERGLLAKHHSGYNMTLVTGYFSEPYGMTISPEDTPALYTLLENSLITCEIGVGAVKRFFKRQRPCLKFKEPTGSGEVMEETNYSYPSGHAVRGWITAMILTEVNPKVCDRVFALAREYAENRVIVGAHWQSDIEASAMLAIMYMTMLRTNSDFQDDLEAAQAEFVQLNQ